VISSAARDALGSSFAADIGLESLGMWQLNGLRDSVELLQVRADGLLDNFPPPRPAALARRR
jgi:hypothetical protein